MYETIYKQNTYLPKPGTILQRPKCHIIRQISYVEVLGITRLTKQNLESARLPQDRTSP